MKPNPRGRPRLSAGIRWEESSCVSRSSRYNSSVAWTRHPKQVPATYRARSCRRRSAVRGPQGRARCVEDRAVTRICYKCKRGKPEDQFYGWSEDRKVGLADGCICDDCRGTRPQDYDRRNRFLKIIGFNSYKHYLKSEMWKTIRGMVLKLDDGRCVVCGKPATNVHHNSYEMDVLIGKDLRQLMSLCRYHHKEAEFDERAKKRELPEVREALRSKGLDIPTLIRQHVPARIVHMDRSAPIKGRSTGVMKNVRANDKARAPYDASAVAAEEEAARVFDRAQQQKKAKAEWIAMRSGKPVEPWWMKK